MRLVIPLTGLDRSTGAEVLALQGTLETATKINNKSNSIVECCHGVIPDCMHERTQ